MIPAERQESYFGDARYFSADVKNCAASVRA
jgi:hypothetical protein